MLRMRKISIRLWLSVVAVALLAAILLLPGISRALSGPAPDARAQAAPAHLPQRAIAGGEGAGLREAPGGPVIETLPLATAMWITGRTADGAWLQVELDDGRSGWVSRDEAVAFGLELVPVLDVPVQTEAAPAVSAPGETGAEASTLTARVNTGRRNLNLRRGPGTTYGIVGVAKRGEELTVIARDEGGDWLLASLPGTDEVAWAAARYLDVDGDPAGLPVSDRLSQARVVSSASGYRASSTGLTGKLVFQTASGGPIMVYDLATEKSRQLTTGMDPAISPDGQTVAFIRDGGGDSGLYLIGIDGGSERRIFTESKLRTPAWSPDGAWIAFSRVTGQGQCRDVGHGVCLPDAPWLGQFPLRVFDLRGLSRVDAAGGSFTDISALEGAFAPDWGEAGILYQSPAGLQVTGAGPDAATRPLLDNFRYQDPAWSPDSSALLFVSLEKDHREIFRANADGSGVVALTHPADPILHPEPVQHVAPAWSPDGKHILFLSNPSGDWAFYVMDAEGRNQRRLPIDLPVTYRYQGEQVVDWGR